jgi:hypothetical protein
MFRECQEAAREIDWLEEQLSLAREAVRALRYLQQAALIRGHDTIADAIEAAPLKSAGHEKF